MGGDAMSSVEIPLVSSIYAGFSKVVVIQNSRRCRHIY